MEFITVKTIVIHDEKLYIDYATVIIYNDGKVKHDLSDKIFSSVKNATISLRKILKNKPWLVLR